MDQLFSMGKSMFKKSGGSGGGGGGGLTNPASYLKSFDKDGDGQITENDFVLAINQMGLGSVGEGAVRAAFKKIDKNQNGKLDMSEALGLVEVVKGLMQSNKALALREVQSYVIQ